VLRDRIPALCEKLKGYSQSEMAAVKVQARDQTIVSQVSQSLGSLLKVKSLLDFKPSEIALKVQSTNLTKIPDPVLNTIA
jgi:hypothetical protein